MKQVEYKDWLAEFTKLTKKYISEINWETIIFEEEDFGVIGDELQADALENCGGESLGISEWDNYDESCADRTDFQIELKNHWEEQLEIRANEE